MNMGEYLIHYGTKYHSGRYPFGSGERPYQSYEKTSNSIFSKAKANEKTITRDVVSSITKTGSSVYGLEHRQKTKASIRRKLSLGKDVKDALRYTSVSQDNDFVKNYNQCKNELELLGYKEIRCKNYFDEYKKGLVKHKSVQCNYKNKNGYVFEIQFQTPKSQAVKDKKTKMYEEVRNPKVSDKRKTEILIKMAEMADTIPDPKNIRKIRSHG